MSTDDYYRHTDYKILQIMPAPVGTRSVYKSGPTFDERPIMAFALCRIREDVHQKGKLVQKARSRRAVIGVENALSFLFLEEGTGELRLCTVEDGHVGYLAPGETLEQLKDAWEEEPEHKAVPLGSV